MAETAPDRLRNLFDRAAEDYDPTRRQLVPCFDRLYGTALDLVPFGADEPVAVLDLGAGTGLFAGLLAERFPKARFTLVDASEAMLERARTRFARVGREAEFVAADYARTDLPGRFDAIVSALSIHHLSNIDKRALFRRVRQHLLVEGVFVNVDQVLGRTPDIQARYRARWRAEATALGAAEETIQAAEERMREDRPATIADQLAWLDAAGFGNANVWFQDGMFAVFAAERDPRPERPGG